MIFRMQICTLPTHDCAQMIRMIAEFKRLSAKNVPDHYLEKISKAIEITARHHDSPSGYLKKTILIPAFTCPNFAGFAEQATSLH